MGIAVIANFMLPQSLNNVGMLIVSQVSCEFTSQMKASGYISFGKNGRNFSTCAIDNFLPDSKMLVLSPVSSALYSFVIIDMFSPLAQE